MNETLICFLLETNSAKLKNRGKKKTTTSLDGCCHQSPSATDN